MTHYHFIGVGGAGLSPIARYLLEKGHQVSGCDLLPSNLLHKMEKLGVEVFIGHDTGHIQDADVIIRSSAIPDSNEEVIAGSVKGIPVFKRKDFLEEMTAGKQVIAVAGTHGKTTTTAMIAWCLTAMGQDPSFVIGGISKNLSTNAHAGTGKYFIIEADEYDRMFLGLRPYVLVVTNIEHDHPDHFPTPQDYFDAFFQLTELVTFNGWLVVCGDNPGAKKLVEQARNDLSILCYGTTPQCDYIANNVRHRPYRGVCFDFKTRKTNGKRVHPIELLLSGIHNALNASATLSVLHLLGQDLGSAQKALENFTGTGRRFDVVGEVDGMVIIDDYAHHPSEIRATLSAARCQFPDKSIWCVWQPHTYSRTRELMQNFAEAFDDCDHVIVTDIFASREKQQEFTSEQVVAHMCHPDVKHINHLSDVSHYLTGQMRSGDILLVLSAGDADQISREVYNFFLRRDKKEHGN